MKIPFIAQSTKVQSKQMGVAYDPSSEIKAQSAAIKNIESVVNLVEGFQNSFRAAEDKADLTRYKKASTDLSRKMAEKKAEILLDPENKIEADQVYNAYLQPMVDDFKKNQLPNIVSGRNLSQYENSFSVTESEMILADSTDNLDRRIRDTAATIGVDLEDQILAGNDAAAESNYNQIIKLQGIGTANKIKNNAFQKRYDLERMNAFNEYKTGSISYQEYQEKITAIGLQSPETFGEMDKQRNILSSAKIMNETNKQLQQITQDSIKLINEGFEKGDLDVISITAKNSNLPPEYVDLVQQTALSKLSQIAAQESSFKQEKLDIGNDATDFLEGYQALLRGENVNVNDLLGVAYGSNDPRVGELAILLVGDLISDAAREGKTISLHEGILSLDKIGMKEFNNQETPMGQYSADYFDNVLKVIYTQSPDDGIKFLNKKAKQWTKWKNNNPNATNDDYLEFRTDNLRIYNQNIIKNSSTTGIGRFQSNMEINANSIASEVYGD